MSFLTDLFHGDFSNLGNDITHGWKGELEGAAALGLGALTFGAGDVALGAAGGLSGLFGGGAEAAGAGLGAEAAGAAAGGADAALGGSSALSLAAPEAAGAAGSEGVGAIEGAISAGGGVGGEAAPLGLTYGPAGSVVPGAETALPDAAAAGGGTGGSSAGGGSGFLNNLWEGAKSSITKNPLGIGAAGVGLGLNVLKGNPTNPNQQALQQQAQQLGAQGQVLQNYLTTGTLPPAMKAQLDQATAAAKARIVSNHAASGQPTDPNQNSALAQELNAVDMNAVAAMADAQLKMMQTGLNETGLSSQLYEMLVKMDKSNNTDLMNAISSFASSLGGGGSKTIQLKAA